MKLEIYQQLLSINAGFDQAVRGLTALRKNQDFLQKELARYSAQVKELRASTNSFLLGVMENVETKEAGRRFGKRRQRELSEE